MTALVTAVLVLASLASPFQPSAHAATSTVSGTITGSENPAVGAPGVQVYLRLNSDCYNEDCAVDYLTTTDAAGHYSANVQRTGVVGLMFVDDQYATKYVTVNLVAGQTTAGQNFVLQLVPKLSFHVYYNDAAHTPAADRLIGLVLGGSADERYAASDMNGLVTFFDLPPGNFRLTDTQYPAAFADQRVIMGTTNTTIPDLVIAGPITFTRVNITVTRLDGSAAPNTEVSLIGIAPTATKYVGKTDPNGLLIRYAVAPGTYQLSANGTSPSVPTWWRDSSSPEGATPLVIGDSGGSVSYGIVLHAEGTLTSDQPVISGTPALGSVLSALPGTWTPTPVKFAYQWTRNGSAIPGATASAYTVVGADLGLPVSVNVTGTKTGYGSAARTAASVTPDPGFTAAPVPTVAGSTVPGSTLTGTVGVWMPAPDRFAYSWLRNGVVIAGETARTHRLVTADLGSTVTFRVTATKAGIPSVTKTSAPTGTVAYAFTAGAVPVISGRPTVGTQLTASTGSVTPAATSFTYSWLKNGVPVAGATTSKYTPRVGDTGATLSVRVTAVRSGYTSLVRTSVSTVVIQNGFTATPTPAIIGAAKVGVTLVASTSSWRPLPVQLSFQWRVNGVVVPDTGGTIYNPTPADIGKTITLTVTGTKDGFLTESRTSVATRPVVGALSAVTPTVTGTAKAGSTLTAHAGTWGPAPVTLSYRWLRGGTPISGATAGTYRLTTADSGKSITLTVTGTKAGYATLVKTSATTKIAP